jgi:hypothetical protein
MAGFGIAVRGCGWQVRDASCHSPRRPLIRVRSNGDCCFNVSQGCIYSCVSFRGSFSIEKLSASARRSRAFRFLESTSMLEIRETALTRPTAGKSPWEASPSCKQAPRILASYIRLSAPRTRSSTDAPPGGTIRPPTLHARLPGARVQKTLSCSVPRSTRLSAPATTLVHRRVACLQCQRLRSRLR